MGRKLRPTKRLKFKREGEERVPGTQFDMVILSEERRAYINSLVQTEGKKLSEAVLKMLYGDETKFKRPSTKKEV